MSPSRPEVTVVIPTRNRARLLAGALRSALWQLDVELEVVVVDDASTDGTAELLARCDDGCVRHIRHSSPRGVAAARNRAIAEAQGEWIAFLDDDDLWAREWLCTSLGVARERDAGLVYGSRWVVDGERRVRGSLIAEHPDALADALADHNALGGPSSVVVRRGALAEAGGFDERLSALADWDLWLRLFDVCSPAAVPELLTAYTIYPDNMHLRDPFGVLAEFRLLARMVAARDGAIGALREARFLRWLATENGHWGNSSSAARLWARSAWRARKPRHLARAAWTLFEGARGDPGPFAVPDWIQALACEPAEEGADLAAPIRLPR
jgi:glycosyltransferase involved in cell wall biosynthesis